MVMMTLDTQQSLTLVAPVLTVDDFFRAPKVVLVVPPLA
jgi:hypothetical protein